MQQKKVINLTLGSSGEGNMKSDWHESDLPSLSDHRYTWFQVGIKVITTVTFRDPKRTN
jgi:hypothetical protein